MGARDEHELPREEDGASAQERRKMYSRQALQKFSCEIESSQVLFDLMSRVVSVELTFRYQKMQEERVGREERQE